MKNQTSQYGGYLIFAVLDPAVISASQSKVRFALIFLFAASGNHIQSPLQAVCQNIAKAHFRLLTDCIFDDLEKQESVVSFGG